ncbi:polymorphic toxin type 50 domain-containing protein [Actinobaculum suis]|uniref:polymorphic toxin type 50 domain-containing protein n=1 Tax=Actinobaculum suis TaxID=1657 RepID=UPI0009F61540
MSKPRSKMIDYKGRIFRAVRGFTTEVHFGKQSKHLPGQQGYDPKRSPITLDITRIQALVELKAGTGEWWGKNREVIDCGVIVGLYRDVRTGKSRPTSRATIHYSQTGCHLVPAHPLTRS